MELKELLGLTPAEWECLRHRLNAPDAIADALCNVDEPEFDIDHIIGLADRMSNGDTCYDYPIERAAILEDAVDGSTYYGCAEGEATNAKLAAIGRVGDSLARKVSKFIGKEVRFPHY